VSVEATAKKYLSALLEGHSVVLVRSPRLARRAGQRCRFSRRARPAQACCEWENVEINSPIATTEARITEIPHIAD